MLTALTQIDDHIEQRRAVDRMSAEIKEYEAQVKAMHDEAPDEVPQARPHQATPAVITSNDRLGSPDRPLLVQDLERRQHSHPAFRFFHAELRRFVGQRAHASGLVASSTMEIRLDNHGLVRY